MEKQGNMPLKCRMRSFVSTIFFLLFLLKWATISHHTLLRFSKEHIIFYLTAILRQLSILRLRLLELLPVRPLRQLPEDIFGSAIIQGLVCSPNDVLQPEVLGLEILQPLVDPLEGVVRKIPSEKIHVQPSGLPAGCCLRVIMRGRWRRGVWPPDTRRRASG